MWIPNGSHSSRLGKGWSGGQKQKVKQDLACRICRVLNSAYWRDMGRVKNYAVYPRTLVSKISELAKYHLRINLHSLSDPHYVEWLHPEPLSHLQHHFMPHITDLNSWSNLAVLLPLVVNFKTRLNYFYHDSAKVFKLVDVTLGYPAIIILPSLAPMFINLWFFFFFFSLHLIIIVPRYLLTN